MGDPEGALLGAVQNGDVKQIQNLKESGANLNEAVFVEGKSTSLLIVAMNSCLRYVLITSH